MATMNERMATVETSCGHMLTLQMECRDEMRAIRRELTGEEGVTTRVTRCEGELKTLAPRVEKAESKVEQLTVRAASFSGLATLLMIVLGEVVKGIFF